MSAAAADAPPAPAADPEAERKAAALANYRKALLRHKEVDSRVRALRDTVRDLKKTYDKTEDDLKALQSVGQIIGEVLRQLDEERCESSFALACLAFERRDGRERGALVVSSSSFGVAPAVCA
jgi:ATP-dependent 26S proteasome regulatory subunit